jgi:hypothetical protein
MNDHPSPSHGIVVLDDGSGPLTRKANSGRGGFDACGMQIRLTVA